MAGAYLAGRIALDGGDVLTAARQFEEALAAEPENPELRRQIFLLRLAGGAFDQALVNAAELLEYGVESDEARMLLAFDALKAGRFDEAAERLSEVSDAGITGMSKPLVASWMDLARGQEQAALEGLTSDPNRGGLALVRAYHHGAMLALLGRLDEAYAVLQANAVADQRMPTRLLLALVAVESRTGRHDQAVALVDAQLALSSEDIVLEHLHDSLTSGADVSLPIDSPAAGMADALLSLARALSDQRAGGQGLLLARLASFLAPDDGDVWLLIAQQMLAEDNSKAALEALSHIDQAGIYGWDAGLLEASTLASMDRTDDAVARLRALAEARPDRSDALVTLGDLLRREERYADAQKAYSDAISRIESKGLGLPPGYWRLLYARGISFERTDQWPAAEADFLQALELEPDQPFVLNYLGYSWVDKGIHLDEGKEMLRKAVALRPEDGFIVDSLGWAHYRLGEFGDAVTQLERAAELQPDDPVVNDHLGDAYWRVGREREARFQWQRALIFKPTQEVVAEIERKLRSGLPAFEPAHGAERG